MRTAPASVLTFDDWSIAEIVEMILAEAFGNISDAILAGPWEVPEWKAKQAIYDFLTKQRSVEKWEKERNKKRSRDIDQEKLRRIVDGRTS